LQNIFWDRLKFLISVSGRNGDKKLPTYVMIMLVGFRDTVMITKPIGIAWTAEKGTALLLARLAE